MMDHALDDEAQRPFLIAKDSEKAHDFPISHDKRRGSTTTIVTISLLISLLCNIVTIFVVLGHRSSGAPMTVDSGQ